MLLHQLGENLVLALKPLFQRAHLLLQLAFTSRRPGSFEGPGTVFEKYPLPLVKQAWVDLVLLAQIGHCLAFDKVHPQDLYFLFRTEVPPFWLIHYCAFLGHQCVSSITKSAFTNLRQASAPISAKPWCMC